MSPATPSQCRRFSVDHALDVSQTLNDHNSHYAFKKPLTGPFAHTKSHAICCTESTFTTLQSLALTATVALTEIQIQIQDKNTVSSPFAFSVADGRRSQSSKIVVEKLTKNVTEAHLREIFGSYGRIESVDLPLNKQFMTNRGTAYILYDHPSGSESAIAHMHEAQLDGVSISELTIWWPTAIPLCTTAAARATSIQIPKPPSPSRRIRWRQTRPRRRRVCSKRHTFAIAFTTEEAQEVTIVLKVTIQNSAPKTWSSSSEPTTTEETKSQLQFSKQLQQEQERNKKPVEKQT
ncbi:hypothetical protein A1O7_06203 [Cladophialophora yegresii CBS 114405]|uniref:RRM domain-containing protein n=1 Tax=Cladophialophora yegresii CBS 114405 TaxID=1182544 RepID=W9VT71_9EURO|nr:uncharacterized protein A1O7_06203 [Cladophialophora yegresii CBS 114405]EXJ58773.1 hypothetical protein A1O7_06203 [Cladophialophora yegresii CBS 114405]